MVVPGVPDLQLKGADKYNVAIADLERFVDVQATSAAYNLDTNLALLRHLQFAPSLEAVPTLAKVLLKALSQLPRTDFRTCLMVVPERLLADETVLKLVELATALETTRFTDFWSLVNANKPLTSLVPEFEDAARSYILLVLSFTFQRVNKQVLGGALQLEGAALDVLIAKHVKESGWQVSGSVVTLQRNELNSPVVVKRSEVVRFEQIAPVLRCVTTGF